MSLGDPLSNLSIFDSTNITYDKPGKNPHTINNFIHGGRISSFERSDLKKLTRDQLYRIAKAKDYKSTNLKLKKKDFIDIILV